MTTTTSVEAINMDRLIVTEVDGVIVSRCSVGLYCECGECLAESENMPTCSECEALVNDNAILCEECFTASMTRATQCPTTGCSNDLLPEQAECEPCRRARIEFDSAGFVRDANEYAKEKAAMSAEEVIPGYHNFLTQLDQHLKESDPEWYAQVQEALRDWEEERTKNPCHPSCQAREEADAATYYRDPITTDEACAADEVCARFQARADREHDAWLAEMKAGQRAEDRTNGGIEPTPDDASTDIYPEGHVPCAECGEPCSECATGESYCADCACGIIYAESGIPSENASSGFDRFGIMVLAALFALFLFTPTTHAAPYTPTAPVGCHITHFWQDDLSAIAVCIGGYTITKEDGPTDTWDDVLFATGVMLVGPDANGQYHEYTTFD